jgi:hypothetical protein
MVHVGVLVVGHVDGLVLFEKTLLAVVLLAVAHAEMMVAVLVVSGRLFF